MPTVLSEYRCLGESETLAKNNPISIVDDDESVREARAGLMKSHGYLEETFASGESFLSSDHRSRTDRLIDDGQMPGMARLEPHNQLGAAREASPPLPIPTHPDA